MTATQPKTLSQYSLVELEAKLNKAKARAGSGGIKVFTLNGLVNGVGAKEISRLETAIEIRRQKQQAATPAPKKEKKQNHDLQKS